MLEFRDRFDIPIPDEKVKEMPFFRPEEGSVELEYLRERRRALGGFVPSRTTVSAPMPTPDRDFFEEFFRAVERDISTTMVFVQMLRSLLKHEELGDRIVPIVPDEARTFGMESLFRQYKIYASQGQLYEPVDAEMLLSYSESRDGQLLEEGITEAGSMCSFTAAGTSYANHGVDMIPFFIFYSMFGFQRIGDLIWAFGDQRGRGFLLGATSGRTTLNGEGLQHEDGHSHVLASTVPNLLCYDPAFHYEIALIVQDGLRRMYHEREDVFYYITLCNENYPMPAMPEGCEEGVLRGLYKLRPGTGREGWPKAHLLGSGSLLKDALRAQEILAGEFRVSCDVWSATSYKTVRYEAMECERWNMLHPEEEPRIPYVARLFEEEEGPVVAVSDYMKSVPDQIAPWVPGGMLTLGTDGYGRSDTREALRRHFEIDAESQVVAVLYQLARRGEVSNEDVAEALQKFGIDPEKRNPLYA
jgi:pyruvate dehydrogenase E1 component